MRINNYYLNNPIFMDKNVFQKGSIFKGTILDIFKDEVLMEIKEYGTFRATLDSKTKINTNDELTFLVTSSKEERIEIKALFINDLEGAEIEKGSNNNLLSKLLDNINNNKLNIKDSELSLELTKSLMENNVHLNEENLMNSIKLLDKLVELSYLDNDKKVIFLDGKNNKEQDINYNTDIEDNTNKSYLYSFHKSHIKYLLVTDKNSYPEKRDLSLIVKDFLYENKDIRLDEFPKLISFIIKNNIEPSLNNIQNIRKLNNDPDKFLKEFLIIKENLKMFIRNNSGKKEFINKVELLQEDLVKGKILEINGFKKLEKIVEEIKNLKDFNIKDEIDLFTNKMDFLKEINKNISLMFIPINYEPDNLKGVLSFLKKRNKKTKNGKTNVFISLNTRVLGNIKIACELYMENINVKIKIQENDLELFKSQEHRLIKKIKNIGYDLNNIEYELHGELKLIDQIVVNDNPIYFLDIKV